MKTNQIRKLFLEYFEKKGHTVVPSSPLVPANDPTLLFTNAGMVQFKETFLGLEKRSYVRAASCQRCVRAGGKHNDLENVGYTARHHTFFEMLGNFSFGDYFKKEAIHYAWDFLTNVLKIPKTRLWITVYKEDQEAEDIWLKDIKVDPLRFSRCGEKDNFWSMGDTGPCGPCTEIFYDHGPEIPGGPPGSPEEGGDRYIEIWNLVFMQFNRAEEGTLTALPKPSVDTGMGLERVAAVMQGVHSNYEIDIFQTLIHAVMKITHTTDPNNKSLRVIADHIRACAFLVMDGVIPCNEGRGYVLRRICRRAIRHGVMLGMHEPFFYKLVKTLTAVMGDAYPELKEKEKIVEQILQQEEVQFAKTLEQGLKILEQDISQLKNKMPGTDGVIPGETVFKLYDTYGFPVDLTNDIARERDLTLDLDGFNEAMAKQRTRAREASQFVAEYSDHVDIQHSTEFTGYHHLEQPSPIVALYSKGQALSELTAGSEGAVVLETTPFYAESGGQVGDQGVLILTQGADGKKITDDKKIEFIVKNTRKSGQAHLHYGILKHGSLKLGDVLLAKVDTQKRRATALNHSATHLLHAALRKTLGTHVQQKGSLVEPQRLRFDFTHFEPLTGEQIRTIEHIVNEQIRLNSPVKTDEMSVEEALKTGAMALFGEKYEAKVRVLRMGYEIEGERAGESSSARESASGRASESERNIKDFSLELCGGTHVQRTGDIGFFKITSESGIAAGVRRIEAVTGELAVQFVDNLENLLDQLAGSLKSGRESLQDKLELLLTKNKQLEKELAQTRKNLVSGQSNGLDLSNKVKKIGNVNFLAAEVPITDAKTLREMVDQYKDKLKSAIIILAGVEGEKVVLIAGVTQDSTDKVKAGELVKIVAARLGGQGGGRSDMAQGGGALASNDKETLAQALQEALDWVNEQYAK